MTQEEKELLLKDLCARLPYGVKIQSWYGEIITSDLNTFPFSMKEMNEEDMGDQLNGFKPYLRPMSSMTEEEYEEFKSVEPYYGLAPFEYIGDWGPNIEVLDWLNAHQFDYRGLIPMGLALEAPEDMYKI